MNYVTITQVAKDFGISTRTLRYYEKINLLHSLRTDEYAYRVYDETALLQLQKILILRKLRISLKDIQGIFDDPTTNRMLEVFVAKAQELEDEQAALSTMKLILETFIHQLQTYSSVSLQQVLNEDEELLTAINALSLTKIPFKEEKSMSDLHDANAKLTKLKNVRVIQLPTSTVASSHYIGDAPEDHAYEQLAVFIQQSSLYTHKPDAKIYGFNHPNPTAEQPVYGYELWVTIPDDFPVTAPLEKKQMPGGLYAAHAITMGNFHEWEWLAKWVTEENPLYGPRVLDDQGQQMNGLLEEHINGIFNAHQQIEAGADRQLDLLFPIQKLTE